MAASATASGPPGSGVRSRKLREAFDKALEQTIGAISLDAMEAAYPTLPSSLVSSGHRQVTNFLRTATSQEFDLICQNRDLWTKLDALDTLAAASTIGHAAATAAGAAPAADRVGGAALLRAAFLPAKEVEVARLREAVLAQEQRNAALQREVEALRNQYTHRTAAVTEAAASLDALHRATERLPLDAIWSIVQAVDGSAAAEERIPRKRSASTSNGSLPVSRTASSAAESTTPVAVLSTVPMPGGGTGSGNGGGAS